MRTTAFAGAIVHILLLGPTALATTVLDPSDTNILYTGRWDFSDTSAPWCQAKGSSLIVNFQGTSIAVDLSGSNSEYLRVIIDDDASNSTKIPLVGGLNSLASGLADTTHKLELIKETDQARLQIHGIHLADGRSLLAPPARPTRRIEFYGDSNLAGYSLESERNESAVSLRGSYYGYAGITARMFNAEYVNFSRSGATISSLRTAHDQIDWATSTPLWNFSNFPADLVVVNIGANDNGPVRRKKGRYHDLLDDLRTEHPGAHIILYNAFGWSFNEPANFIHEVIAEREDPNMSSAVFPWVFPQWHGCEFDHAGMAMYLADHATSVLGWVAAPQDVMSGFGTGGDVANGSFEEVAPFGGWGWRYHDDSGVSRVHDAAGAFDGSYYLRLADGAHTQQTNPASSGDTFEVTVWMRGASDGDQAGITMDFRDQGMGGREVAPMVAYTETKTLTTSWKQYSMVATAPASGNPVFAIRLTFTAAAGSTVDIDDVLEGLRDEPGCGDGTCNAGETPCTCPADCGVPPGTETNCSDGIDEDCDSATDCSDSDCDGAPDCLSGCDGDGVCEPGEDCDNCPDDCDSKRNGKPSNRYCCGNGVQEGPEGDGRCDGHF